MDIEGRGEPRDVKKGITRELSMDLEMDTQPLKRYLPPWTFKSVLLHNKNLLENIFADISTQNNIRY